MVEPPESHRTPITKEDTASTLPATYSFTTRLTAARSSATPQVKNWGAAGSAECSVGNRGFPAALTHPSANCAIVYRVMIPRPMCWPGGSTMRQASRHRFRRTSQRLCVRVWGQGEGQGAPRLRRGPTCGGTREIHRRFNASRGAQVETATRHRGTRGTAPPSEA